jgi:hypothetical protein
MGYIATNQGRTQYKLGFSRRSRVSDKMRTGVAAALSANYVALASELYDFGLDRPVQFASHSEAPRIEADQLPCELLALRVGHRDIVVLLYESEDVYIGVMGASYQAAAALNRYMAYNWLSLDWIADGSVGDAPNALRVLYADAIECIAGVDLDMTIAVVHANRAFVDNDSRPQFLRDLIEARSKGRLADLEMAVTNARFERVVSHVSELAVAA